MPQGLAVVCLCGIVFAAQSSGVWLDVPFVRQEKDGCGAAVILTSHELPSPAGDVTIVTV